MTTERRPLEPPQRTTQFEQVPMALAKEIALQESARLAISPRRLRVRKARRRTGGGK
jgi:hypothetical protein